MAYKFIIKLSVLIGLIATYTASAQVISATPEREEIFESYSQPVAIAEHNTPFNDYAPAYDPIGNRTIYCSEKPGWAALFCCLLDGSHQSATSTRVAGTFNADGENRAFVSFASSGEGVGSVFVQYDDYPRPTLVTLLRDNGEINAGLPIESVQSMDFNSHPSISQDGTRLVFSTDRAGGAGLDLWIADRHNDRSWSAPTPLSDVINSTGDEITPYFIGNDSLLYASNGYGGKGGFDIFLSVLRDGVWQEPEPLEWINSEFDDSDCAMLPDGTIVFASNRPGGKGGLDLYITKRNSPKDR